MTPRLYINAPLLADGAAPLDAAQAHYLKNVLRRAVGDAVLLFNERDGEFAAEIAELKKKGGVAVLKNQTRAAEQQVDLQLLMAPVKRGPLETIIQKATEIGVAQITRVITARTTSAKINTERLQAIALEAAEQSGRLSVPTIDASVKLQAALDQWPADRRIMFCDEAGDDETEEWGGGEGRAAPALEILRAVDSKSHSWAVLTGPEGGFSAEERALLRAHPNVHPVTLGPRILRADTAAIAALVLWQAALGDWRTS